MSLTINKFGGGVIDGAPAIRHLPKVFESHVKENSVNVFSAFGKTTNNLEKVVKAHIAQNPLEAKKTLDELKAFHLAIAHELFSEGHIIFSIIEDIFTKIQTVLEKIGEVNEKQVPFLYDQIVPYGEILASLIVSNYFSSINIPNKLVHATDFLKTDSNFQAANVDREETYENLKRQITQELLAAHKNIITQGFIGYSETGTMTTLGREGSDYTAGILGNLMDAKKVVLWKDVPGVMDKNPKTDPEKTAKKIDSISYDEFREHLQTSAKGLVHEKTLNEVKEKKIPLQVRPFKSVDSENSEGTTIG